MRRYALLLSGLLVLLSSSCWAAIVAGPWLQAATETQMVVMWESSDDVAGSVNYGATTSYGTTVASTRVTVPAVIDTATGLPMEDVSTGPDTPAILHTVRITGLTANTLYHYRVISGATVGTDFTFRTHKASGTWRIVHASDPEYWKLSQARVARDAIKNYAPDYIIMPGDLTQNSINNHFRRLVQDDNDLFAKTVFYTARGNHDNRTFTTYNQWFYNGQTGGTSWGNCFTGDCENFYSFDIGNVHYVSINNNQRQVDYPAGAVSWLTADLAASSAQWKIVFMKANPGITWNENASNNAKFLMPLFEAGGVQLVLCGGNSNGFHNQVNGVWYQHAGMANSWGYFGIDISVTALDITHFNKEGTVHYTYRIAAATPGNNPPNAVASATPTSGIFPLNVTFNGTASTDSDGTVAAYNWNFGDGTTSGGATPTHSYAAAGVYSVVLTVTDNDGATDTAGVTITVTTPIPTNIAPIAGISATPTTGNFPLAVAFSGASSTDSDGTIASYAWNFADGATATGASPSHTYTIAGGFNAVVTVTDDDGATDSAAVMITVTDPTPSTDKTVEITPAADATVDATAPTTNYGTDTVLVIRQPVASSLDRISYLHFDLGPIPAGVTVESAVLHLYAVAGSGVLPIKVHAVTSPWEEMTVTWTSRPTTGAALGTLNVASPSAYHQLDLTTAVQALYALNAPLQIALLDDTHAGIFVRLSSHQSTTNRPKLVVSYTSDTLPPPEPDPPGDFTPCPNFDTYRGCVSITTATPLLNGYFRTEKLNNRWWFMTPEGHGFIALSVSSLTPSANDGADQTGNRYIEYANIKYGGSPTTPNRPAWANATLDRLRKLGFNTIGTFSHNIQGLDPDQGIISRLAWVPTLSLTNHTTVQPTRLVGNIFLNVQGGGIFPDMYHPNFVPAVTARATAMITPAMATDPYILYYFPDQADQLRGIAYDHGSICYAAWTGQPTLPIGPVATPTFVPNYTKQKLADDMQAKYGTIAALNAAWGMAYTSFGSDGGYGVGTGFLDQGAQDVIGYTYEGLEATATPAMNADCNAWVEEILSYYATLVTTTIKAVDPNHLISSPNDSSNEETVKAFDGKFEVLFCELTSCYDLLTTKMPLGAMDFDFLSAEMDSPLSLDGVVSTTTEITGVQLKFWDPAQTHCWMPLATLGRVRMVFFDEAGNIKNYGFLANGNEFNIISNGIDETGCWFLIGSRGGGTGKVDEIDAVSAPLFYRRHGFSPDYFGPPQTFKGVGYDTQELKAQSWQEHIYAGLRERAANGDFFRVGANWWKMSDNGWTYPLEHTNFGLVTLKDNAYDGQEATLVGADGIPGTWDDEEEDYGDLWTVVMETNLSVYGAAVATTGRPRRRGFVW